MKATWSGTQAMDAADGFRKALGNKMIIDYFDDAEKEVIQLLLDKAAAGYEEAVRNAKAHKYS